MSEITLRPIPTVPTSTASPTTTRLPIHARQHIPLFGGLIAILIGLFVVNLMVGSVNIPLDQIARVLLGGEADKASWTQIVLKFRLPKAITALLAGAALSVSGLMMQTFFRNPLADPFTLGISSGASLGVALVVLSVGTVGGTVLAGLGLIGDMSLALAASIGAGMTLMLVMLTARRVANVTTLLILGLMFGSLTGALVSLLMYFSIPERIQAFMNWGFGTFGATTWDQLVIFAPLMVVGLMLAFRMAKSLNALLLGETYARSMGLDVRKARLGVMLATGILAGVVTAFCGPIGFLGVTVPHVCRALFKTVDHRTLIPAAGCVGAITALIAALIAEVPGSSLVLPVNAVTALFGAPMVIWILLRSSWLTRN